MLTRPDSSARGAGEGRVFLLAAVAALALPHAAVAQAPPTATVVGRVLEVGSDRPVPATSIRLEAIGRVTESDEDGRFEFGDLPLGSYVLAAAHLSYASVRDSVELRVPGGVYDVEVRLAVDAIELAGIAVEVRRTPGPLGDVRDRMERVERLGMGHLFDRDDIDRSGAYRVSYLLGQLPGARLRPIPGRVGVTELFLHARNACSPSYYLDGIQTAIPGTSVDDLVPLTDVEAMEVYRRVSNIPGEFADERALNCGVVAIWTRRGYDDGEPFGWTRFLTAAGFLGLSFLTSSLWF